MLIKAVAKRLVAIGCYVGSVDALISQRLQQFESVVFYIGFCSF